MQHGSLAMVNRKHGSAMPPKRLTEHILTDGLFLTGGSMNGPDDFFSVARAMATDCRVVIFSTTGS
jgi:hypothetical protein